MARSPSAETRHHVDVHVGKQLALARHAQGLNQSEVARMLGLTFQQIQKYETGMNRISASRLWDIAATLGVPVQYFFDGLDEANTTAANQPDDLLADKEALDLIRSYYAIPENQRRRLFDLARVLSDAAA